MASGHPTDKFSFMYQPDTHKSKNRLSSAMNPVYSPVQPGTPYGNPKNMAFADINECQEQRCDWQCVNLPGSHRCICPRGYTLHGDGQRCRDINECSRRNGGCSHLCLNQRGGYKCACPPSHRLSPYSWKKCVTRATATTAG